MGKQKTAAYSFLPINSEGDKLLGTQPGVSVIDALEMVTCMLSASRKILYNAPHESEEVNGATYLVEAAAGIVNVCISGLMKGGGHA